MKTSHLFCFCSESWISGCFEEIQMRMGVNGARMQSLFTHLVDATVHLSRNYTISQLWPACTRLRKPGDCKATGERDSHPARRVKMKFLVDTQHGGFYLLQRVILAVCFILMPPRCQSDKTFATEAVTEHLTQIRVPHWFWMIILRHRAHIDSFSKRVSIIFYWSAFLYKQRWYIGRVIGGLNYMAWK